MVAEQFVLILYFIWFSPKNLTSAEPSIYLSMLVIKSLLERDVIQCGLYTEKVPLTKHLNIL